MDDAVDEDLTSFDAAEATRRLDEVLQAAGLGGVGDGSLGAVGVSGGAVTVTVRRGERPYEQDILAFPEFVLDADDPVAEARHWGVMRRCRRQAGTAEAQRRLDVLQAAVGLCTDDKGVTDLGTLKRCWFYAVTGEDEPVGARPWGEIVDEARRRGARA